MWFLTLFACIKPAGPVQAPTPLDLRVAPVVTSYDTALIALGGEALVEELSAEIAAHALRAAPITELGALASARNADARLAALGDGPVLLVEAAPRFSSQMAGRYRWTVDVTLALRGVGAPEDRTFTVPVALVYDHERELAAVDAAAPAIASELREVLDHALSAP